MIKLLNDEGLANVLSQSSLRVVSPLVIYRDLLKLSDEERKHWQAEVSRREAEIGRQASERAAQMLNEQRRMVEEILRPDQRERLSEIDLQWRGVLALVDKNLSRRLGISSVHYDRIAEIVAGFEVKRVTLLSYRETAESPRYQKRRAFAGNRAASPGSSLT